MSDENNILPLDLDFSGADLSMPLIAPGNHLVVIHSAEIVKSKNTPDSYNLKVVCKTVDVCEDPEGKQVQPGFQLTTYLQIPIPGTEYGEGENKAMFIKKLTLFQVAVAGLVAKGDVAPEVPKFNNVYVAELPSKHVVAQTKNAKQKAKPGQEEEYGIRSEILGFKANLPAE